MKRYEQVHIFEGSDIIELEKMYNEWFKMQVEFHLSVPSLASIPFKILDRVMSIRNYDGTETFALAIFYEYFELEVYEQGPDRGAGRNLGGTSVFPRKG